MIITLFYICITSVGYDAISRTLCNQSTILDTYFSNHTLSKFGEDEEITLLPSNLSRTDEDLQDTFQW